MSSNVLRDIPREIIEAAGVQPWWKMKTHAEMTNALNKIVRQLDTSADNLTEMAENALNRAGEDLNVARTTTDKRTAAYRNAGARRCQEDAREMLNEANAYRQLRARLLKDLRATPRV